ncbi:uncharacterized protein [Eurosta solidaginis]|uniref:uncharacterized protein isoform X2 n=1 Tax=Eurosta solidaginis TaxID=178769 RepID=UPI0035311267
MNEFDGKKFYGFSLHDDPALSTTTRNFEFKVTLCFNLKIRLSPTLQFSNVFFLRTSQYARAEHLERAIQKVQHNGPENNRYRKKDSLSRVCKAKKMPTMAEVTTPYQRDADIETHVSRSDAAGRVRALSNTEISQLIDKVRSCSDLRSQNSTDTYAKGKDITKTSMKPLSTLKSILRPTINEFPRGGSIGGTYYPNIRTQQADELGEELSCDDDPFFETRSIHLPHVRRELHSDGGKLPDVPEEDELFATKTVMPIMYEEFRQAQPKWVEICEIPAKPKAEFDIIKKALYMDSPALVSAQHGLNRIDDERLPTNVTYTQHSHEMQLPIPISTPEMMLTHIPPPPSLPNLVLTYACSSYDDQASTYYVDDSDLEYEMIGRPEYTKLCGPRPNTEELIDHSNGSGGLAEFVEVEPKVPCMNLSFLKNVSPIRYSDLTDERDEERMHQPKQPMKVVIKSRSTKSPLPIAEKAAPTTGVNDVKKKTIKPKKKPVEELKPSARKNLSPRCNNSSPVTVKSPRTSRINSRGSTSPSPRRKKDRAHQSNTVRSNELRLMKNIVLSKSIEDLKIEKMGLFAKMTSTQERIIETLDKLRISLLELYVPDNHYEKTRRQKNAFEFSVRFSRNFLYPLKGMIEDLRLVSVEQLCSASSNEATQRVLNIFVLIQQSLQTYYKQLRYFLLDQVPQKLNSLIELASAAINICLEKQVFDRNDAIIECLQERCSKFLGFLEDMHEERFLTARENYRKAFDKTSSNYSLKMFMNDLNMYEPKLVPKNHYNQRRKPKQRRILKPSSTITKVKANTPKIITPKTSQMIITKPDGDHILTQVNELRTSSGVFHSTADKMVPPAEPSVHSDDLPNLNKALIEALQTVTKEQMRQALQPIMQTLGTVLEKKNASETIDELLKAFSKNLVSLAEGEQTKTSGEEHSGNMEKVRAEDESKTAKQTERHHSRHRHSNSESTKRDDPAVAFFGNFTPAPETTICDVDVDDDDDDDDDNYYDDDAKSGDGVANDDDDDCDDNAKRRKVSTDLLEPTETTEPTVLTGPTSEVTETTDSMPDFQDKSNDKRSANTKKASVKKMIVFNNFNLCAGTNSDRDDGLSESSSDFESFEGNSSQFDVVIPMKPDRNKVSGQEQAKQQRQPQQPQQQQQEQQQQQGHKQQQREHHSTNKEQYQRKNERQQQQKNEQTQDYKAFEQLKQSKRQQQLILQQLHQQQPERQQQKSLRERAENYDTHIQQQQQQAYEELMKQRQLKKLNQNSANAKNSPIEILQKSRELQKELENQLAEHQRYIIAQQQQRLLHQKQLQEQQMLEREEEINLKEHQKQQQQQRQQQQKQAPMPPQKSVMGKQNLSQSVQEVKSTVMSCHSSRASTSQHPSSSRPQAATSRGRVTSRIKTPGSSRAASQSDKVKLLKKRRNPLNSPPPAPSVTPNSVRTPRSRLVISDNDIGESAVDLISPSLKSFNKNVCFAESSGDGVCGHGGGGDADAMITSDSSQTQMFRMCSKEKTDLVDMIVPLANAFHILGCDSSKNEQPKTLKQSKASTATTKKSEALANHDLIEALTNCLFKFNSGQKQNTQKVDKQNGNAHEENGELRDADSSTSLTLYTCDSPYEKVKSKKKHKSMKPQQGISKDSNKDEPIAESEQVNHAECGHKTQTKLANDAGGITNRQPLASPSTLWNANPQPAVQKKDLHIEGLIAERDHFLRLCSKNRFYANPNFNQPWSVFSKIAAKISDDIVSMIEKDFSIGVSKFVQDFLDNETKIQLYGCHN